MAKKYKYIKRVRTKSGSWRYIYDKPSTRESPDAKSAYDTINDIAVGAFKAGKKVRETYDQAYNYASDKADTARRKSAVATQKRKLKQEAWAKSNRKANQYTPQDPYKVDKPWRGDSALSARGKKKKKRRGSVYVGPADHFTDMNDAVARPKKKRGSTGKNSKAGR